MAKKKTDYPWDYVTLPKEPMFTEKVETNANGLNTKIKFHLFDDNRMRELGFTDYDESHWYKCVRVDDKGDITFNITLAKDGSYNRIDVLDEDFCQPYDYQAYLSENPPTNKFAYWVFTRVEDIMEIFATVGIVEGHIYGEYI